MDAVLLACPDARAPRAGTLHLAPAAPPASPAMEPGVLADADPAAEPARLQALRQRLAAEAERLANEQPQALRSLFGL